MNGNLRQQNRDLRDQIEEIERTTSEKARSIIVGLEAKVDALEEQRDNKHR